MAGEKDNNTPVSKTENTATQRSFRPSFASGRPPLRKKNTRRTSRGPRIRSEFDQKIINVRRVTRVAAGGKRFNFSVAMILGNRRGLVGVGTGKGADTALAIDKATRSAKKNMLQVSVTPSFSIPHQVWAKYSSARITLIPAPGRGIIAGSAARNVLELAGLRAITAKVFSPSKNTLNIARATILALSRLPARVPAKKPEVAPASPKEEVSKK